MTKRAAMTTRAGMTTRKLDDIGADYLQRRGARSAPRLTNCLSGYNLISAYEEIVYGVPGARVLRAGDVVTIEVTVKLGRYSADSAGTVLIAPIADEGAKLRACAAAAFGRAIRVARAPEAAPGHGARDRARGEAAGRIDPRKMGDRASISRCMPPYILFFEPDAAKYRKSLSRLSGQGGN
jgi:hypothetical protein